MAKPQAATADPGNPSSADPGNPSSADPENPASAPAVASVLQRWKREGLQKKGGTLLRGAGCLFSMLSFVIMCSNRHDDWKNFDRFQEFRYVVAIGVLAFLYTGIQLVLQALKDSSKVNDLWSRRTSAIVDFGGDQMIAYLLMSALSAAIPLINRMREGQDNIFTDQLAASVSMAFFAFVAMSLSAMLYGYKLSTQTYI